MDSSKYDRNITMLCPTCGCDQFEIENGVDETIELAKCASCGREITKDDLEGSPKTEPAIMLVPGPF